jgi:N-formylglutamate deformylase
MNPMPAPPAFQPVTESRAAGAETAVLIDSPHSGSIYPPDFRHACDRRLLRATEDAFVDTLFGFAPSQGVTLIQAHFPRSYIDVNRHCDDIDPLLLDPRADAGAADVKSKLGMGLVWRTVNGQAIYAAPLSRAEVQHRIDTCWRPYHAMLRGAWERITARHGFGIHLNCHSMPSRSPHYGPPPQDVMPHDFVIGDRDGTTASARLTGFVVAWLRARGWRVGLNDPFKGVELIRVTGRPVAHRHALQIEVNKRLYMDEASLDPHAGFDRVQQDLRLLVGELSTLRAADLDTSRLKV